MPDRWVREPLAAEWWMTPACWVTAGLSASIGLVWLWSTSWPGGLGLAQFVILLMVAAAGVIWVVLVSLHVAGRWLNRSTRRRTGSSWSIRGSTALAMSGVLWMVAVWAVATDVPLRARFELSRPAFESAAAMSESAQPFEHVESSGRLGWYPAGQIVAGLDSVVVEPRNPGGGNGWFEYLPDGTPPGWAADGSRHRLSLGDGWWAVWSSPIPLD
jgi:hypothetical protein